MYINYCFLINTFKTIVKKCMKVLYINYLVLIKHNFVTFLVEKCQLPVLKSYAMDHVQNCRAFWKCILGKSYGMCCPEGKRYKPYVGCVDDPTCTDACPPMSAGLGSCDSRPIFGVPAKFEQYVPGYGWREMPCAPGTQYNPAECGCTTNVPVQQTDKSTYP